MKLKKIMAVASCAALIAATAAPLAACGGGRSNGKPLPKGELVLSDYALDVEDSRLASDECSKSAVKLIELGTDISSFNSIGNRGVFAVGEKENASGVSTYTIYNVKTGKTLASGLKNMPSSVNSYNDNARYNFARVLIPAAAGERSSYTFYGEDGTKLVEGSSSESYFQTSEAYVDGKRSTVLMFGGVKAADATPLEKFFKVERDDDGNNYFTEISKSSIKLSNSDVSAGDQVFGVTRPVYPKDEDRPVEGEIANYSYAVNGTEMIFYNGNTESGRVDIDGVENSMFVGDYMYYQVMTLLPSDGDANLIINDGDGYLKFDYTQYRYNILTQKKEKLDYDKYVTRMMAVYNYKNKSYDAAVVECYGKNNCVMQTFDYSYLVTAEFGVAYDLTNLDYEGAFELIKADDGKYLVNTGYNSYTVVNDNMEMLCRAERVKYYAEEKIFVYNEDSCFGFTDLSGKAIVAPVYADIYSSTLPTFYGGYALVGDTTTQKVVSLSVTGATKELPVSSLTATTEVEVNYEDGWYYVTTTTAATENTAEKTVVELFDLGGTLLKKIDVERNLSVDNGIVTVRKNDGKFGVWIVK